MESPNAVSGNKAPSDVTRGEDMDCSSPVGEATSSKNYEEKVGFPAGSSIQGAKELNPDDNLSNSNDEILPVVLAPSEDSPKEVDLGKASLEIDSLKAEDETPLVVQDPVDESSKRENFDGPNQEADSTSANAGEIPPMAQDPSQDSAKGDNPDVEIPSVEPEASDAENSVPEEGEYACKYCDRTFTNKQSLGGHQNAHKFERALEKDAFEAREPSGGYFSGTSSYPRMASPLASLTGSMKRSYEYMNMPLQINRPMYQSQQMLQQHQGMQVARPLMPSMLPQAVPRHFQERYPSDHPGWPLSVSRNLTPVPTVPVPRISPFVTAQSSYLPSLALTLQFPNAGAPSSSSWPVAQGLPAFPGLRSVRRRNGVGWNNNQMNIPGNEEDDSGLDLTLRL